METLHLLVLEDDPDDRLIFAKLLDEIDFWRADVTWCARYEEAVEAIVRGPFDLALVDFQLGADTGLDFLMEPAVRATGVPVIVLTGVAGRDLDLTVMRAGAVDFLPKDGLSASLLERSIRYAVEARRRYRAEVRYRGLVEHSRDLISILDAGGNLSYVSPSVRDILGVDPEERLGQPALEEVHPDDRERVVEALAQLVSGTEETVELQYRVRHANGTWRVLHTVAQNLLGAPEVGGVVVRSRDTTERVEREERIRFQALLLDAVGQAVIATDPAGCVTYWNQAAEELYGWSRAEALGALIVDLTPAPTSKEQATEIMRQLEAGQRWSGEFTLRRRDGSTFQGAVTNSPVLDADGALLGIVGISSDITARTTLEEQLRMAQRMEAVGRLAGGVAHDFHNILTAVGGHAELLLQDLPEDSPLRDDALQIQRSATRAGDLTRQLLAFSRKQLLEQMVVDLRVLLTDVAPMLRRLIAATSHIRIEEGGAGTLVRADPTQLHQVILNLALNAADAIHERGEITLGVDTVTINAQEAVRNHWSIEAGCYARLTVRDTGVGMPADVVEHIFEPFFTTKQKGHGTGLGLATVFGIVKQSHGHVFVESAEGVGTTFRVLLPVVEGEVAIRELDANTAGLSGHETVLLVEDDEAVRNLTRRVLERAGYRVLAAENGEQALAIAAEQDGSIPLLLSDMVMPNMGGVELARHIRERHPGIAVVLMSGYAEEELAADGRSVAAGFVGKPFTRQELLGAVRRALDGRAGEAGAEER